jgi:hypothetical protein
MTWVATAIVGTGLLTYASGQAQAGAARDASGKQVDAANRSTDIQNQQFQQVQRLLSPFVQAGTGTASGNIDFAAIAQTPQMQEYMQKAGFSPAQWIQAARQDFQSGKYGNDANSWIAAQNAELSKVGLAPLEGQQYVTSGGGTKGSLQSQQDLLGLNGNDAQSSAIQGIKDSPQFTAMQQLGENRILQNASATGGLRGGNTQAALAQFSPALLSQLIDSQYAKLGGLTTMSQNSAAGVGAAGQNYANAASANLGQIGAAQAGAALAGGKATAQVYNSLGNAIGNFAGYGGFGGGFSPPIGNGMPNSASVI